MAEDKEKKSYPMLPIGTWWQLRRQFKKSIPGVVTDSYLATVLTMQPNSARANVLPYLKDLGIIEEDGKPTRRAALWRDDGHYNSVCVAMLKEVYPSELFHAVPDPGDRTAAERWFANQTGAGEAAVRRMAALYALLTKADASAQPNEKGKKEKKERPVRKAADATKKSAVAVPAGARQIAGDGVELGGGEARRPEARRQGPPDININLQIHISADATPDQIDQIFASMAKHIYHRD